jgi:hypothetical protein
MSTFKNKTNEMLTGRIGNNSNSKPKHVNNSNKNAVLVFNTLKQKVV